MSDISALPASPSVPTEQAADGAAYHVVTWGSEADGAVARIRMPMLSAKGKVKLDWLPVVIHAATEPLAVEKAHAFFASEQERLAKRDTGMARRLEAARTARAAKRGGDAGGVNP